MVVRWAILSIPQISKPGGRRRRQRESPADSNPPHPWRPPGISALTEHEISRGAASTGLDIEFLLVQYGLQEPWCHRSHETHHQQARIVVGKLSSCVYFIGRPCPKDKRKCGAGELTSRSANLRLQLCWLPWFRWQRHPAGAEHCHQSGHPETLAERARGNPSQRCSRNRHAFVSKPGGGLHPSRRRLRAVDRRQGRFSSAARRP